MMEDLTIGIRVVVVLFALYGLTKFITARNQHEKNAAVMWVLQHASADGMMALDICKISGVSVSDIYPLLSKLEDRGLVRWTRAEEWPHRYRYHFIEEEARKKIAEMQARKDL